MVQDRDLACIGDVWKLSSLATPSWLQSKVLGSSYQPCRHWQSCVSSEQASVNTCQSLRDNGGVSSEKKGDGGTVPSSASEMASRSGEL